MLVDREYMRRDKPSSHSQGNADVQRLLKNVKRSRLVSPGWLIPAFVVGLAFGVAIGYGIHVFV